MKILYNHQIFHLKYGGIARYYIELAKNISLYKKKVEIKINSPFYKNIFLHNSRKKFLLRGLKVPDFKGSGRLCSVTNSIFSPFLCKQYNPNIIHETYYNSLNNNLKSAKKIITVHDMIHEIFPHEFKKKDSTFELKKLAVNKADHIICVSKTTQRDLIKFLNVNINKTSVIYHGLPFKKKEVKISKKNFKPYILYVGSRNGYKNFTRFAKAYSSPKIKNFFNLLIFGGNKLNYDEIYLLKKLKIPIENFKQVDGDDLILAEYYKNASLFVYPSLYEGFGFPPLEAMAYECPVVCSNTGSIPEIVGDSAILFDPYSVESIRDNMISVIYDEKKKSSLKLKGLKKIKNFSWEKCAVETYEVYKKVLGS